MGEFVKTIQCLLLFKKCYTLTDDAVYAALYIRYLGFLK